MYASSTSPSRAYRLISALTAATTAPASSAACQTASLALLVANSAMIRTRDQRPQASCSLRRLRAPVQLGLERCDEHANLGRHAASARIDRVQGAAVHRVF